MLSRPFTCFLFIIANPLIGSGQESTFTVEGEYKGQNLYVQNPVGPDGTSCVKNVLVNGKEQEFSNESAFEIAFDTAKFRLGDRVEVKFIHTNGCVPKILQPWGCAPVSTAEFVNISLDSSGLLKWDTKKELNKMSYTIEQFRWNKWVKVGEVDGKGSYNGNTYTFKIADMHTGENKFRVKQANNSGRQIVSGIACIVSINKKMSVDIKPKEGRLEFSRPTMYELYDASGNILACGNEKSIDISPLKKSRMAYFLNYDNTTMEFKITPQKK